MKLAGKIEASHLSTPLIVFNAIDTFLSIKYIKLGPLYEMNPMIDWLLAHETFWFIIYKLFFVAVFILILALCSHKKIARLSLYFLFVLYSGVMLWWSYMIFLMW